MFCVKRSFQVCIIIIVFGIGKAFPQEEIHTSSLSHIQIPSKISLEDAKLIAFQNNWDFLAAKSDVDQALAQKIISQQLPNPTLSFFAQKLLDRPYSASANDGGFLGKDYHTIVNLNQLFEIAGNRSNRQKSAMSGLEAAKARLEDSRRILNVGVTKAYCDALFAQDKLKILQNSTKLLKEEATLAQLRFKSGDISEAEKNQIEMSAQRFELDTKNAQANEKNLKSSLQMILGDSKPDGNIQLTDAFETLWKTHELRNFEDSHTSSRPDLLAAQADVEKAKAELRLQKAMRVPDPTFNLQYEHNPPDQPNAFGGGISFPFPLLNQNRGGIQSAQANEWQARINLEKLKAQITSEVETAKTNYSEAASRFKHYTNDIKPKSAKVLDSFAFAYKKGNVSLIDYLVIQREDNEIKIASAQAAADAITASANLSTVLNLNNDSYEKHGIQ